MQNFLTQLMQLTGAWSALYQRALDGLLCSRTDYQEVRVLTHSGVAIPAACSLACKVCIGVLHMASALPWLESSSRRRCSKPSQKARRSSFCQQCQFLDVSHLARLRSSRSLAVRMSSFALRVAVRVSSSVAVRPDSPCVTPDFRKAA